MYEYHLLINVNNVYLSSDLLRNLISKVDEIAKYLLNNCKLQSC